VAWEGVVAPGPHTVSGSECLTALAWYGPVMADDEISLQVSVEFALLLNGVAEDRGLTVEDLLEQAFDAWLEKHPSLPLDDEWRARLGWLLDERSRVAATLDIGDEAAERIIEEEIDADRREQDERRARHP
jgi:hypothetical protein